MLYHLMDAALALGAGIGIVIIFILLVFLLGAGVLWIIDIIFRALSFFKDDDEFPGDFP